jgi:hypothetical protein
MMLETFNRLEKDGTLKQLFNGGFISGKILYYHELALKVDADMKINKSSKSVAIENVSEKYKISSKTVRRAVNCFLE